MSSFIVKFEAIQSRMASRYAGPSAVPGRVHAIRLQRCLKLHHQPSRAFAAHQSHRNTAQPQPTIDHKLDCATLGEDVVSTTKSGEERPEDTLEKTTIQTPAPDLVKRVPYPSVQLEARLRLLHARRERRSKVRLKVPGEDGDSTPPISFSLHGRDYEVTFFEALRQGNPHLVLAVLGKLVSHDGIKHTSHFLEDLPAPTFSALLHCLDPKHFVGRYQELHKGISVKTAKLLRLPPVDIHGYYKFCDQFLNQVNGLFAARHRATPMSSSDFRYLLKCARATGNGLIANEIWTNLSQLKQRAIVPDLDCYNHYLATLCWADTLNPSLRYRLRMVPRYYTPRAWSVPPRELRGYRVGKGGLKARVSEVFREMIQYGVAGNEETFCHMMIAFAREGDITGVESILKRVWDIDVETLMKPEGAEPPVKDYARGSPFYPSEQLLYTIAHAYGLNNAIPTALRLLDHVSRQYTMSIPRNVWRELLMWTYVLSTKRFPRLRDDGTIDEHIEVPQVLPLVAMSNLWATMVSEPYNVRPTIDMYDRFIRNLILRERFGEAQKYMEEARKLYKVEMASLLQLLNAVNDTYPRVDNPTLDSRMRDMDYLQLKARRNRLFLKAWVRFLLEKVQYQLDHPEWQHRGMPDFVRLWKLFLPNSIGYHVASGHVSFWTGTVSEHRFRRWARNAEATPSSSSQ